MTDADLECEAMLSLFFGVCVRLSLDLTRLARLVLVGLFTYGGHLLSLVGHLS
jgi:hypothetical protein